MSIYTEITQRQRAVEALSADAVTAYRRALLELLPGIEAQVLATAQRAAAMDATEGAVFTALRAREIRRQIEAEISRLTAALSGQLVQGQTLAALRGLEAAEAAITAAGVDIAVWTRIPLSSVVAQVAAVQGETLGALLAKLGPDAGQSVARELVRGVVMGQNPRAVARTIRGIGGLGDWRRIGRA